MFQKENFRKSSVQTVRIITIFKYNNIADVNWK